jgi:spoIIIJ-associated protein
MLQKIYISGKTFEDAKKVAYERFSKQVDQLKIEEFKENPPTIILEVPIENLKEDLFNLSTKFFDKAFNLYSIEGTISEPEFDDNYYIVRIRTNNDLFFVKNNAQILLTLQELINAIGKKQLGFEPRIILDCKDYRLHRNDFLKTIALKKAEEVKKTRRSFIFYPLDSYERKVIHTALQNDDEVTTESEGNSKYKRVKILLKNK